MKRQTNSLRRAEKMAIGHNIPEDYKVQFTVNGLDAKFKQRIISKEPKTFQELRHALALAKAGLECAIENPTANISVNEICAAVAAQLQQTIKQEVSAIASAHSVGSRPQQQPRFQKQWHPRPQNQWRQSQTAMAKWTISKSMGTRTVAKMDRTQDHRSTSSSDNPDHSFHRDADVAAVVSHVLIEHLVPRTTPNVQTVLECTILLKCVAVHPPHNKPHNSFKVHNRDSRLSLARIGTTWTK